MTGRRPTKRDARRLLDALGGADGVDVADHVATPQEIRDALGETRPPGGCAQDRWTVWDLALVEFLTDFTVVCPDGLDAPADETVGAVVLSGDTPPAVERAVAPYTPSREFVDVWRQDAAGGARDA